MNSKLVKMSKINSKLIDKKLLKKNIDKPENILNTNYLYLVNKFGNEQYVKILYWRPL